MTVAEHMILFNRSLRLEIPLPDGVEVMNPFSNEKTRTLSEQFYRRFYNDGEQRVLILGINPGRLGGGSTGIPFTDPVKLGENCGIPNDLKKVTEPSAGFIYDVLDAFGGVDLFYSQYLIHAVCPLGFTLNGLNYNYYDSRALELAVTPFILDSIDQICRFPVSKEMCFCLGNGKNYKYLLNINKKYNWFEKVEPLPHPRWIVQYRRKRYTEFVEMYKIALAR